MLYKPKEIDKTCIGFFSTPRTNQLGVKKEPKRGEREQTISSLKSRGIVRSDAKGAGADAPIDFENAHMNSSISRNFKTKNIQKLCKHVLLLMPFTHDIILLIILFKNNYLK